MARKNGNNWPRWKNPYSTTKSEAPSKGQTRSELTFIVVRWGFFIICAFGLITIGLQWLVEELDGKEIFHTIVPLFASWIGAVIAFYFGKENLESASKALGLTSDKLDDIPVENVMITLETMVAEKVEGGKEKDVKLNELINFYRKADKDRIPILSPDNVPRYIIHRSSVMDFIKKKEEEADYTSNTSDAGNGTTTPTILTLRNLLDENTEKYGYDTQEGFVTVSADTTVEQARNKMLESKKNCQDVFVTKNGKPDGKVLGWMTDSLIQRFLRV